MLQHLRMEMHIWFVVLVMNKGAIMKKGTDYEMGPKKAKMATKGGAVTFPQNTPIAKKRKANNAKTTKSCGY